MMGSGYMSKRSKQMNVGTGWDGTDRPSSQELKRHAWVIFSNGTSSLNTPVTLPPKTENAPPILLSILASLCV